MAWLSGQKLVALRSWQRARAPLALLVLIGATLFFAHFVDTFYPLREWLFFRFAAYWLALAAFGLACLSSGHLALRKLVLEPPPLGERFALSMGLGVLIFFLGSFVAGLLGLFGRVFFFAWPLLLIAVGARELWRSFQRARRRLRRFGSALYAPRGALEIAALLLLALGLVGTYLVIIVPMNIGADAHWYHLPIAERYASAGRITRFEDGWYLGVYPQLASVLYTWAFQSPGLLNDHTALSSHIEWFLFVVTLASIAPLARRLLGGRRVRFAGAMLFLFPGILLYDSSLITGADHVLAFWAPPLALALIRCGRDFNARNATLASLMLSGALLTKYQGSYFLVAAGLFLLGMTIKTRRLNVAAVAFLVGLVATSPHWLKNLIFHGDPLYPLLHERLSVRPFHPGAAELLKQIYWAPQFLLHGSAWEKLRDTLVSLVSFSFVPHDWDFHGQKPIFGSLFTLSLLVLPLLKAKLRVWLLVLGTHVGIATWFVTSHQDRFLQALLPWMVACTVAMLSLAWRQLPLARIGICSLVGLQLVWGGDVYFFRSHSMIGESPVKAAVDLIASGHQQRYHPDERLRIAGDVQDVGRRLPASAVVLLHSNTGLLGTAHPVVNDLPGWQGAIEYLELDSPERTAQMWRSLGVTHIAFRLQRGPAGFDTLARELVFARAVDRYSDNVTGIASFTVTTLKQAAVAENADPTKVLWIGCDNRAVGLFTPKGLAEGPPYRELTQLGSVSPSDYEALLADANAAVVRPACNRLPAVNEFVQQRFRAVGTVGDAQLYVR
ncbi:MAG: hypothetical protein ACOY0T_00290 [Myxococcota bacterium]